MDQAIINFDINEATVRKEEGLVTASLTRKDLLDVAKIIAARLAWKNGTVTYDDVFKEMRAQGYHPECMGNAAGSVFRGDQFVFTGEWRKSTRVTNHARVIRVWKMKE